MGGSNPPAAIEREPHEVALPADLIGKGFPQALALQWRKESNNR
jgi:hypothetical protein